MPAPTTIKLYFFISSDNIFNEKAIIYETWVQGQRFNYQDLDVKDYSGEYKLSVNDQLFNLSITGEPGSQKAEIVVNDSSRTSIESKFSKGLVTMSFEPEKNKGRIRLSGWEIEKGFEGEGQLPDGNWVSWNASFDKAIDKLRIIDREAC